MKTPQQIAVAEVTPSLAAGRRTDAFEAAILELFDPRDRPHIQTALSLLPAVTPSVLREAFAAREFIATVGQFGSDQECADYMRETMFPELSTEQIVRAGRRKITEVNKVLRKWHVI